MQIGNWWREEKGPHRELKILFELESGESAFCEESLQREDEIEEESAMAEEERVETQRAWRLGGDN